MEYRFLVSYTSKAADGFLKEYNVKTETLQEAMKLVRMLVTGAGKMKAVGMPVIERI